MSLVRNTRFLHNIARGCVSYRLSCHYTVRSVLLQIHYVCNSSHLTLSPARQYTNLLLANYRCYSKKAKKEKGGKKSKLGKPKVELSSEELNSVFDHDKLTQQLNQSIMELKQNYASQLSLRTTTGSFEQLVIHTDDGKFPLIQLAQITQKTPQLLIINMASTPQYMTAIKESIEASGLNVSPQQDGTSLFVPIPKVTRDHREELAKSAKALCDKTKVKLRDIHNRFSKDIKKQKGLHSEDLLHALQDNLHYLTQQYSDEADSLMAAKQRELLS